MISYTFLHFYRTSHEKGRKQNGLYVSLHHTEPCHSSQVPKIPSHKLLLAEYELIQLFDSAIHSTQLVAIMLQALQLRGGEVT